MTTITEKSLPEYLEVIRTYRMCLSQIGKSNPEEVELIQGGQQHAHALMLRLFRKMMTDGQLSG